jgi:2-polyprenyl-3-methyl-5-hydroxy-6-metoxy-1,4-benzoquinol methylase
MTEVATFIARDRCLSCNGSVRELSSGFFDDDPLHSFIANDPWGESPIPFLRGCRWEYVQCEKCELAFHRRILSPEWNTRRFEKWMTADAIAEYERIRSTPRSALDRGIHFAKHALQLERLTRDIRGAGPVRVLDFGCGNGEFIQQCSLLGFKTAGVDRSHARQEKNLSPVYADTRDLLGQTFHAITLFEVLEHLDDPRSVLESLIPLLAGGGILILETPNCSGVTTIKTHHDYAMINPLDHINGFTPITMRRFVERLGLTSISPPISHVTTDLRRVGKTELKRMLKFAVPAKTQQYFWKPK